MDGTNGKDGMSAKRVSQDNDKDDKEDKPKAKDCNTSGWIAKFLKRPGNEWLEEVDLDFLNDFTNLMGLEDEISHMSQGLHAILSNGLYLDANGNSKIHSKTEGKYLEAAETLYGLVHVRYLFTNKGLVKVFRNYKEGKYGVCPRHFCNKATVLPIGMSDKVGQGKVKVYCPKCEDVYHSTLRRDQAPDGAYFGMSLPQMFFMAYPALHPQAAIGHYVPRLHGFRIHSSAYQVECDREPKEVKKANKHNQKPTSKHSFRKHSKSKGKERLSDDSKENDAIQDNKPSKLPQINGHAHVEKTKMPRRRRERRKIADNGVE